jgi:AcrR family transcriptional regulator
MTENRSYRPHAQYDGPVSRRLSCAERRRQLLDVAGEQFLATGFRSTTTALIAKAAGVSEAVLYAHFASKEELFQAAIERNSQDRLQALAERFLQIPGLPPVETLECIAEATVLACVGGAGNAGIMNWGLMELPEFASDVYRFEIGATEALWDAEIGRRFGRSPIRSRVTVHLAPYAVHACMAFGLWLATLRHKPVTARAHARQYAGGIADAARAILNDPAESLSSSVPLPVECGLER